MKIIGIPAVKPSKLSFTSGNVSLYSDFDGTYFPSSHSKLHNISERDTEVLNKYFQNLCLFFENKKIILLSILQQEELSVSLKLLPD